MSKPQDGFVSRFLNRPISHRVTDILLKFQIPPNACTIAIFVLPLVAAVFLVRGDYLSVVIGAAIFQAFSVLDGCDGEIARAKNLESRFGEHLDNFCDFLASLLYVLALGWGIHRWTEGIICAGLITINEWLIRYSTGGMWADSSALNESFYARHHGMIEQTRHGSLRFLCSGTTRLLSLDFESLDNRCRCERGPQRDCRNQVWLC